MQYPLDARLLPPSGASVQCTRCGHVFVASPTGAVPPAPKVPPAGAVDRTGAPSSTAIFGGEGASGLKSTQLFAGSTTAPGFVPRPTPESGPLTSSGVIPPPPSIAPVASQPRPPMGPPASGVHPPQGAAPARTFGAPGPAFSGAAGPQGASAASSVAPVGPGPQRQSSPAQGAGSAAPGGATRAFGAVSASSSGQFRLAEPGGVARPTGAVAGAPSEAGGATRVFGAVSGPTGASSGNPDSSSGATRAFGAVSGPQDSQGAESAVRSTRAFGAVSGPAEPPVSRAAPPSFENISPAGDPLDPPWSGAAGPRSRLAPEGHHDTPWATSGPTVSVSLPDDAPFARAEPLKSSVPSSGESLLGGGLDRPLPPRGAPREPPPELLGAARSEPALIEYSSGSSSMLPRVLLVFAVLAGIALAGYLAYPAFRDRNAAMPAEAVEQKDRAVVLLRRDDPSSREQAIQSLQTLATAHPKYAEVQAELAVALTLQLGDLYAQLDQLRIQSEQLNRQLNEVTTSKSSVDWMNRANAIRDDVRVVERDMQPLRDDTAARRKELDTLMESVRAAPEVEPAATVAARLKAHALFAAVTGAPNALALAERLRQTELTPAWSVLARAEFALSSGSPAATLKAVSEELDALRSQDRTLMRTYVLGARLALRQGDTATARKLLDETLAFNGKHELARRMLAQVPASDPEP